MRIAICEDLPEDTRQIAESLSEYLAASGLDADVDSFLSGEDFLAAFEPGKYQIIFMDIYMKAGGITGVDAAAKVTATDREAAVIFVTTSEEHVLEGYNYAVYYVVKPVDKDRLAAAMAKCRRQIEHFAKTIEVVVDRHPVRLRLRDIYSIESLGHTCVFKFAEHEVTASALGFDSLLKSLDGLPFVQSHRSYLVNLLRVKELADKDFIMENGSRVPVSRTHRAVAQKAAREFFWKRIQGDML